MEFASLAHYFEKLEKTSSRLALMTILTELFRSIEHPDEIAKVCYLVQGAHKRTGRRSQAGPRLIVDRTKRVARAGNSHRSVGR